jgi:hypothetical protein
MKERKMKLVKTQNINSSDNLNTQVAMLDRLIKRPPETSRIVEFSPELAEHILTNLNYKNRPRKSGKIIQYANDMLANKWLLTGETIAFGTDGLLKDGQNRLAACVRANTSFTTHVMFGIDPAAFSVMDTGANRSHNDILAIMGVPNYGKVGSSIKLFMSWKAGKTNTGLVKITNEELREYYVNQVDEQAIQRAVKASESVWGTTGYPVSTLGALYYWAFTKGEEEKIIEFYEKLRDGYGRAKSPQKVLMKYVNEMRNDRYRKITSHDYSVMLARAWYNYKNGKSSIKADVVVHIDDKMPAI